MDQGGGQLSFRAIAEHAGYGVGVIDGQGEIHYVNPAFARMVGSNPEQVCGHNVAEFHSGPAMVRLQELLATAAGSEAPVSAEFTFAPGGGELRGVLLSVSRMEGELPDGSMYAVTAMDISERLRAQRELAQVEEHYRTLIEQSLAAEKERLAVTLRSIRDAVITVDTEGRIGMLNRAAETLTGWPSRQVLGRPISEVAPLWPETKPEGRGGLADELARLGGHSDAEHTAILRARDGQERLVSLSVAPIRRSDGSTLGAVFVMRDVTEQRRIEEELLRSQRLESVGQLAGGIAHDFNNILTAITGSLSLARQRSAGVPDLVTHVERVEQAVAQAKALTLQLLAFAKGGAPIKRTVRIGGLLRETSEFALRGSNVRCLCEAREDLWPVEIDEAQIGQVFHNLVLNADQAMPDGGTLRISARNRVIGPSDGLVAGGLAPGRYVEIAVQDEGSGIEQQHLAQVFEFFFSTKKDGSGLGLSSAHSIVLRHGGHIRVESEPGSGAMFEVLLPASEKPVSQPPVDEGPFDPARGRGSVLVVDDQSTVRTVAREMLLELGYDVDAARDGNEALDRFTRARQAARPFDVVIMDLTIPGGMGGKELAQRLRAEDDEVRLIVSSGYSTDPVMSDYRRHHFDGVLRKPYDLQELAVALRPAAQRQRP